MWYVYELIDPRNGKVFYVGKGKGKRIDQHEQEARKQRHGAKNLLIQDIEGEGYQIIKRKVAEFDDELAAYLFEAERIAEIGLENLTNVVKGGGAVRDQTIYEDRDTVRHAVLVFKAVKGKSQVWLRIFGQRFSIAPFLQSLNDKLDSVIERRGLRWVNLISVKEGMRFDG